MNMAYLPKSENPKVDELAQQIVDLLVRSGLSYQEIGDVTYEVRTRISAGTYPMPIGEGVLRADGPESTPPVC